MKSSLFVLPMFFTALLFSQIPENIQRYRNDQKGSAANRAQGTFNANNIRTVFFNNGQVSDWFSGAVSAPHFEWPKGTGHRHLDGFTFMVGAKIKIINTLGQEQIITPIETSYREEMDKDPVTGEIWGFEPLSGYANGVKIAMSNDSSSWPATWPPALGLSSDWNGNWYGYFGKGKRDSLLETFFVMDDSKDKEFTRSPYGFFPISSDSTRGGIGSRVEVRGFQFTNRFLEDVIIWHYEVTNISDNDYDTTAFGFFIDPGVGSVNNNTSFDRKNDLLYAWAPSGKGLPDNYQTGYYGQDFLTTPSNSINGIDDDEDGMIDERRDDGIDNDHDWDSLTDDVGSDGIPSTGDIGEGDGKPTLGEPNFDATDIDESDQIGLQSAYVGYLSDKSPASVWPKNDPMIWAKMVGGFKDTSVVNTNISVVCASGPFSLKKWKQEKISIAMMCGADIAAIVLNKKNVEYAESHNYDFKNFPLAVGNDQEIELTGYSLSQNYPNPFNPATTINYQLPMNGFVSLKVYDLLGNEVATLVNERKAAGNYSVNFNAGQLSSGIYFYRLQTEKFVSIKKLLLVK